MKINRIARFANLLDAVGDKDHLRAANAVDMALQEAQRAVAMDSSLNPSAFALEKVATFSSIMDFEGHVRTANILDNLLKTASELWPSANDRDSKYDSKANNAKSLYRSLENQPKREPVEPVLETMKGNAVSLLTRHSPDYPGVPLMRVSDGVYQDMMTRKVYDFNRGFVSETGVAYPGGSVANQTPTTDQYLGFQQVFESKSLRSRPRSANISFDISKLGSARPFELSSEDFEYADEAHHLLEEFIDAVNPDAATYQDTGTEKEQQHRADFLALADKLGLLGAAREMLKILGFEVNEIEKERPQVMDIFYGYLTELRR